MLSAAMQHEVNAAGDLLCALLHMHEAMYERVIRPGDLAVLVRLLLSPSASKAAWGARILAECYRSILSPGQGWHRRANAQKCYKSPRYSPAGVRAIVLFLRPAPISGSS